MYKKTTTNRKNKLFYVLFLSTVNKKFFGSVFSNTNENKQIL